MDNNEFSFKEVKIIMSCLLLLSFTFPFFTPLALRQDYTKEETETIYKSDSMYLDSIEFEPIELEPLNLVKPYPTYWHIVF